MSWGRGREKRFFKFDVNHQAGRGTKSQSPENGGRKAWQQRAGPMPGAKVRLKRAQKGVEPRTGFFVAAQGETIKKRDPEKIGEKGFCQQRKEGKAKLFRVRGKKKGGGFFSKRRWEMEKVSPYSQTLPRDLSKKKTNKLMGGKKRVGGGKLVGAKVPIHSDNLKEWLKNKKPPKETQKHTPCRETKRYKKPGEERG